MFQNDKRKPKKKTIIIIAIGLIALISVLIVGAYKLNIMKLKGTVYKQYRQGDKFCLDNDKECFYVIEDDGGAYVTAIAEYNLLVGNKVNSDIVDHADDNHPIDTNNPEYGVQSSLTIYHEGDTYIYGGIAFSEEDERSYNNTRLDYWLDDNGNVLQKYVDKDNFVFDDNSLLYEPLNNYLLFLKELGYEDITATLLSYEQALDLGCEYNGNNPYLSSCENVPEYMQNSFFWLGTIIPYGDDAPLNKIPSVYNGSLFATRGVWSYSTGIRPVITIAKSELDADEQEQACTQFEVKEEYEVGDVIAFCNPETNVSEDFYVMGETAINRDIKAIAKYNLYAGNIVTVDNSFNVLSTTMIDPEEEGYGIQNKYAKGLVVGDTRWVGVTNIAPRTVYDSKGRLTEYGFWYQDDTVVYPINVIDERATSAYPIVNGYQNYLTGLGYDLTVDLPCDQDLVYNLGCNASEGTCVGAEPWVYSSTYWTGYTYSAGETTGRLHVVGSNGYFGKDKFYEENYYGIRPRIIISKEALANAANINDDNNTGTDNPGTDEPGDTPSDNPGTDNPGDTPSDNPGENTTVDDDNNSSSNITDTVKDNNSNKSNNISNPKVAANYAKNMDTNKSTATKKIGNKLASNTNSTTKKAEEKEGKQFVKKVKTNNKIKTKDWYIPLIVIAILLMVIIALLIIKNKKEAE